MGKSLEAVLENEQAAAKQDTGFQKPGLKKRRFSQMVGTEANQEDNDKLY